MTPTPNKARLPIIGFAAGTPLLTPQGSKAIEALKPGDLISMPCTHADASNKRRWLTLTVAGQPMKTRADHPFMVHNKGKKRKADADNFSCRAEKGTSLAPGQSNGDRVGCRARGAATYPVPLADSLFPVARSLWELLNAGWAQSQTPVRSTADGRASPSASPRIRLDGFRSRGRGIRS